MTAEVDVHQHRDDACESEAASNGNVSVILNEDGISKDDGDGSYVFVTADDSDLSNVGDNGDQGQGQICSVVVGVVENNESQLQSQSSLAEEAVVESTKPCDPEGRHHIQTEEDQQLRKEVPVQDDDDDDDASRAKLDPESKEIGDELPACDTHDSSSSAEQNGSCLHSVVNGTAAADKNVDAQESVSDPTVTEMVNETSEETGQILPANGVVDKKLEIQVVNATLSDKTGDGDDIKSAPEPIVLDTTEMNDGTCEEILVAEAVKPLETQIINGTVLDEDRLSDVEVQKQLEKQIVVSDGLSNVEVEKQLKKQVVSDVTGDELLTVNAFEDRVSDSINTDPFIDTAGKNNGPCEEDDQILADTVEVEKQLETQIVASDKTGDELPTIYSHEESNSNPIVTASQILVDNAEVQVLETQVIGSSVSNITGEAYEGSISEPRVADTSEDTGSCENVDVLADSLETKKQLETQVVSDPVSDKSGDGFLIFHAHLESISEHIITDDLDDTSAEMGSCEKASVCENVTVENGESLATVSNSDTMVNVKNEDSLPTENDSSSSIEDGTIDVEDSDVKSDNPNSIPQLEAESAQVRDVSFSSCPANDVTSEPNSISKIEDETATVIDGSFSGCQANGGITEPIPESVTKSECDSEFVPVVDDTLPKTNHDATNVDFGLSNVENESDTSPPISIAENNEKSASKISRSVENDATLPASSDADESLVTNDRYGSEVEYTSAERSRGIAIDSDNNDSTLVNGKLNCISGDVQIESEVKLTSQEEELASSDGVQRSDLTSKQEVPTVVSLEGQNKSVEVEKRPFYFLIRNPRNDDENLKEQIRQAQSHVEEKTKIRDAIRSKMQIQRATCKEHYSKFEAVVSEERAAQELLRSKRREMDSVQLMINKVKDALSIEDMANTIRHMEHRMAHETLPLKEEKQYIRDIKQLKQRRDQLAYSLGKQDEVQQALDQKDDIEQRIKDLRKEMDQLKVNLLKAQEVTQAAKKKYNGENDLLHKLQYEFEAADATRQEAYAHLQRLRKQIHEKTKHFWKYRRDAKAANILSLSGNKEQLQHLCLNQVETVMELWKNDCDFRNEYIKCNTRSTLKRLRTADGRALGPDEEPPVIPDLVRVTKHNMAAIVLSPELAKPVAVVETEEPNDKSAVQVVEQDNVIAKAEQNNVTAKAKEPVIVASSGTSPATVSGRDEIEDERADDPRPIKEEEELARKEEELRKEEAAARLREQRRQEEKAKAREAMERKKKTAEKAQARAAIKAQKEAEEKEKEREKRARKKERKKASAAKATIGISEGESALEPSSESTAETPIESETTEKPVTVTKRSQKVPQFTKQTKVKSIPLPLRNRNKRRIQPWMWVLVTILSIFGLFLLGNGGGFSFQSMRERFL